MAQLRFENRFGLDIRELETLHEHRLRLIFTANNADHLIDVQIGDEVAVENFQAPGDFAQAEVCATHQHFFAVVEPFAQRIAQRHHDRHFAAA